MAVSFKTDSSYGYSLLELFNVSPHIIKTAKKQGIVIEQGTPGSFTVRNLVGVVGGVVALKGLTISLAKAGQLGPASKQSIQFQFEAAINTLVVAGIDEPHPDLADNLEAPKPKPQSSQSPTPMAAKDLLLATDLYQQVAGTSAGSIYTVIALLDGGAMAVRIKGDTVSFRVAGNGIAPYKTSLAEVGFSSKDSHFSAHFSIPDPILRKKTLGAICGAIGFEHVMAVGSLSKVGAL